MNAAVPDPFAVVMTRGAWPAVPGGVAKLSVVALLTISERTGTPRSVTVVPPTTKPLPWSSTGVLPVIRPRAGVRSRMVGGAATAPLRTGKM